MNERLYIRISLRGNQTNPTRRPLGLRGASATREREIQKKKAPFGLKLQRTARGRLDSKKLAEANVYIDILKRNTCDRSIDTGKVEKSKSLIHWANEEEGIYMYVWKNSCKHYMCGRIRDN